MKTKSRMMTLAVVLALALTVFLPVIDDTDDSYGAETVFFKYYSQLGDSEEVVYDKILNNATAQNPIAGEVAVDFDPSDFPDDEYPTEVEVEKAFYAFYYDHPEVFWVANNHILTKSGSDVTGVTLKYTAENASELAAEKSAVDKAVSKITVDGEFTYDKVKQIHNWIVENCRYDTEAVGDKDAVEAHNIYGIFVDKAAVCEGYARAFMYLCQKNDIDCIVSIGEGVSDDGSEAHMWNYVQMEDGAWYCMDVTWDDPLVNGSDSGKVYYSYFLKGTDSERSGYKFSESHVDQMNSKNSLNIPSTLSKTEYRFQPDGTEYVSLELCSKSASGDYSDSYTLQVADIPSIRESIGTSGEVLIRTAAFQFRISCADLKTVETTLTAASITEVTFGGTVAKQETKVWTQYDFLESVSFLYEQTKELDACTPTISTGDISSLGLEKMEIGIAAEFESLDLPFFLRVWDISNPELPQTIDSEYTDGYQCFTVSSIGTYASGNNPLSPGLDIPFLFIIGALVLLVIVILLLIKKLIKGRKVKKMAKTMAKSKKNMQHYRQMYEDGEMSKMQRKAYRKAVKIAEKKGTL